jgi:small subunit ribosomal protein S24e
MTMDIQIQHQEERPLLHRKDITARVTYEGATPQRTTLRDSIAHALKTQADHMIIRQIRTEFGKQAAIVTASAYKDAKALEQFEPKHMKKRHGMLKEKKKEEAPTEAK